MKKRMRKRILTAFNIFCILFILSGCDALHTRPASLGDRVEIPSDGIIPASTLETMREENQVVTFYGEANGLPYTWTIFGSDIPGDIADARTLNLGIEITEATEDLVSLRFLSEENFGFRPLLSITLPSPWGADSGTVYRITESGEEEVGSASLTVKEDCILSFTPLEQTGALEIRTDGEPESAGSAGGMTSGDASQSGGPQDDRTQSDGATPSGGAASGETTSGNATQTGNPSPGGASQSGGTASGGKTQTGGSASGDASQSGGSQSGQAQSGSWERPEFDPQHPAPSDNPWPESPEEIHNSSKSDASKEDLESREAHTCILSIECTSILQHLEDLNPDKLDVLPEDGILLPAQEVIFYEGESVFDLLQRVCRENQIQLESSFTPMYNSIYVEGIGNLYEFDCGSLSGWMYRVDGWYPNYGCSLYTLQEGQTVEWRYTCDLGRDIGDVYLG